MDPEALIADLDSDQQLAVTTDARLVAVVAGAGSGKTRVLTRRVAHRVATGSADLSHTLVLTFTREAAGELRRRLPRLGLNERVTAGTFHSFARQLLVQRWADLDQRPRTIVGDRRRIVGSIVGSGELDSIVEEMGWAAARGLDADQYLSARRSGRSAAVDADRVADTMEAYRAEQRRRGVIDLDDLLVMTTEAMRRDESFAEATRWRFRHVLVDEAQDLNPTQHRLVDELRRGVDDLFLVGDPAQAIYGFNGSDPAILRDVGDHFPGVEVIRLPVNHRCTPQVVQAGRYVLATDGQPTDLQSARPDGAAVTVHRHQDEAAEAVWVAADAARLDPSMIRHGNVAVLARTHAALATVRDALAAVGVSVRRNASEAGSPLGAHVADAARSPDNTQLRTWAFDHAGHDTDPIAAEVGAAVLDYLREHPEGDGAGFRLWANTNDPFATREGGVDVLTFHGAKGREWHRVYLVGAETSLVPHRSATTGAARAEEARLLYVAVTRASDELVVNWAERRNGYQRRLSPLLAGFESSEPPTIPPPTDLVSSARSDRSIALERLREWRLSAARAAGVIPDAICTDQALGAIASARPASAQELDEITGWGTMTSNRLFDGVRRAVESA